MSNSTHLKIAIQGIPGAFHHVAAQRLFPNQSLEIVSAKTFEKLLERIHDREQTDCGLMAIENTISGSLLGNYQLLNASGLRVGGEVYLRIVQNLLVLPGVDLHELREVYSHPVALVQCRPFFKRFPKIKLISAEDTALSAKRVRQWGKRKIGAIAPTLAAEMYGLEVAAAGIETYTRNHTRFLLLERRDGSLPKGGNKVSLCFQLGHHVGGLANVLNAFALHRANLTKIQSVPLLDSHFEYLFFVDFLLEADGDLDGIMNVLQKHTRELRLLGRYTPWSEED